MRRQIHGILLLDKSQDMTSNAALQQVKRLFYAKKAGHTGSLDPIATGLLPICFGEATKFSQYLLDSDKTYEVVAKLGVQTTTGDREGEIIAMQTVANVSANDIEKVMLTFLGDQEQIPPMYSAIKYQGKPLYELARDGIEIARQPRKIHIFSLQLHQFEKDIFKFQVHCSKGTYVRTLVEDIGKKFGYGCHVVELRRTRVGSYSKPMMYSLSNLQSILESSGFEGLSACLLPIDTALQWLPTIKLSNSAIFYLRMGQAVRSNMLLDSTLVKLSSEDGRFLGVGEMLPDGKIKPHRLMATVSLDPLPSPPVYAKT